MVAKQDYIPDKGDIIWFDFSPQTGREQSGRRPGLVISSIKYNRGGLLLICPITSKIKKYPFEIPISSRPIEGVILADHVKNQDWKARKPKFITKVPNHILESVREVIVTLLIR